ncbi:pyridoxal 5'-phosphate synthase glutaminase subunit PdxT [Candidatus Bipolaricaulota bacterium]|nr:pyridoxal 5'-phosphate synthase glutaminase subunit PdxT [Candidatus Bipolaricaulota bacterium]
MRIGVLGLQGAVREHVRSLERLGVDTLVVKRVEELPEISALVLPGGESTAISLIGGEPFLERLRDLAKGGFPFFGTCAGMILLASEIEGRSEAYVGAIDITVARNASGRQVHSFETLLEVEGIGGDVPAVFIRAPYITRLGQGVSALAKYNGHVVIARQGNVLVSSFHPELTDDLRIHEYFLNIVKKRNQEDMK